MLKLDDWLLDLATKISHRFQKLTGKTNFFIARFFCLLYIVAILSFCTLGILNMFVAIMGKWFFFVIMPAFFFEVILKITLIKRTYHAEKMALDENPIRTFEIGPGGRLFTLATVIPFMLTASISILYGAVGCLVSFALALFYYFLEVVPLPRHKSKIREWIEKLIVALKPAPILTPVPVEN